MSPISPMAASSSSRRNWSRPSGDASRVKLFPLPATRFAEELGNRLFANLVVLGFFTAITGAASPEAMKKALPGLVPDRFLKANSKCVRQGLRARTFVRAPK